VEAERRVQLVECGPRPSLRRGKPKEQLAAEVDVRIHVRKHVRVRMRYRDRHWRRDAELRSARAVLGTNDAYADRAVDGGSADVEQEVRLQVASERLFLDSEAARWVDGWSVDRTAVANVDAVLTQIR